MLPVSKWPPTLVAAQADRSGAWPSNLVGVGLAGFAIADAFRRSYGRALDVWLARSETPFQVVCDRPQVRLRFYDGDKNRPPLLIAPAPIKKPYIWDLTPSVSVVQRCLDAGFRVYVMEWTEMPPGPDVGISAYADRLILDCTDVIGAPVTLAGHSLGGTFAAIFAALHPDRVRALLLLEAPLSFSGDTGAIAALIRKIPETAALRRFGHYPGTLLNALSITASPESFVWWLWLDRLASVAQPAKLRTHVLVERWTFDESPMPAELFADVVALYQNDQFMKGTLKVSGKLAAAKNVMAPVLAVVDPESDVVPPSSIIPFFDALPHPNWFLLHYEGDTGIALRHLGVLVGESAHRQLWPEILAWLANATRQ